MKEPDKDHLTRYTEKMEELINKGRELKAKEERFRNALGIRLRTPKQPPKK